MKNHEVRRGVIEASVHRKIESAASVGQGVLEVLRAEIGGAHGAPPRRQLFGV